MSRQLPPELPKTQNRGTVSTSKFTNELIRRLNEFGLKGDSIFVHPNIPSDKLQKALGSFALIQQGEQPIFFHDATIMGSCDEGVLFTNRGIYWNWPTAAPEGGDLVKNLKMATKLTENLGGGLAQKIGGQLGKNLNLGKRSEAERITPVQPDSDQAMGFISYQNIEINRVKSNYGGKIIGVRSIDVSSTEAIRFGRISDSDLPKLATFIVQSAQLVQLSLAKSKIAVGDHVSAIQILNQLIASDTCIVPKVIKLLAKVQEDGPSGEGIDQLYQDLVDRSVDLESGWYVRRDQGIATTGPFGVEELRQQYASGKVFANDQIKHFGERYFSQVGDAVPLKEMKPRFYRGTGIYDDHRYQQAAQLAIDSLDDDLIAFFNSGGGKVPLVHVGFTEKEIIVLQSDSTGAFTSSIDHFTSATFAFDESLETLTIATKDLSVELPLSAGLDREQIVKSSSTILMACAREAFAEKKSFLAEKLTRQVAYTDGLKDEIDTMIEEMGVVADLISVYDGGHPTLPEKVLVSVRLDAHGLELSPVTPGSDFYARFPYGDILEVLPPSRGQLPDDLAKELSKSKRNAGMLKAGLGVAAATVIPGGGLLMSGLMGKGGQNLPPTNRVCIVLAIEGSRYRLFFDAFGGTDTEALNDLAKSFWSKALTVQGKFNKPTGRRDSTASPAMGSAEAKQQTALLREIRDLLLKVVSFNEISELRQMVDREEITKEEFAVKLTDLRSPKKPEQQNTGSTIVACPKCDSKLRVQQTGVVACPKCSTKMRVGDDLFRK